VPERRVIKYAVIGQDQVAATPPATDAEIAAVYRNSPLSYGARETRNIQSITLPSQQAADAFAAQVRGGTSFVAAAQQAGFAAADVTFANQNRAQFAGVTNAQIAAAAFAAAQGAVVGPMRSELGYHVVRIDHVTTTAARPLESVRGEIAAAIERRKRGEALAALVQQAEEQLSSGASFEEVARAHNLTIVTTPPVTATGQVVGATAPWTAPADLAPLLHPAFDLDAEEPEPAIETIAANERFAMLGIDRVVAAAPAPLAQISQQVRDALIQQRARQAARALADRIVARINSGTPAAQALAEAQPRIQNARQVDLRRGEINRQGQQTPPALLVLFSLPEGRARVVPAENGAGWFIVFHAHRTPGDASTNAALVQQVRTQFNGSTGEELAQQFARAIELRGDVSRNEQAIIAARRQMSGNATPPAS
jgi:peptidyl-prolyl cis-trans isomerase D